MKTISIRHFGSLQTRDGRFYAPNPVVDLPYRTQKTAIRASHEAIDAGRRSAAEVRANVEQIQTMNRINREFWDKKTEELESSIRR